MLIPLYSDQEQYERFNCIARIKHIYDRPVDDLLSKASKCCFKSVFAFGFNYDGSYDIFHTTLTNGDLCFIKNRIDRYISDIMDD